MPTVRIITHGCKTNQYDSDQIARGLAALGYTIASDTDADAFVVNTCAVTVAAQAKGRKLIRRLARLHPRAVIATGCAAEVAPDSLAGIPGVAAVIGNANKGDVPAALQSILPTSPEPAAHALNATGRTRAVLKVQDGCNMVCSYCIIRLARGPMRSRPAPELLQEIRSLADAGVKEIILTGIRLGAYDDGERDLAELITSARSLLPRIRLSSLDVWDLTPELLAAIADNPSLCPHLHLPLQSGDDGVLRAMKRPYTTHDFVRRVHMARQAIPGIALTTDVMVGFPGESERAFHNTLALLQALQFDSLHVFRYSPRPGTAAAAMDNAVPEQVKTLRSERLLALARESSLRFAQRFVGQQVQVLFETHDAAAATCAGLTPHYLRVTAPGTAHLCNTIAAVTITQAAPGTALGVFETAPAQHSQVGFCPAKAK